MLDINKILVVLDEQLPDQGAFNRSLQLATSLEAEITLVTSCYESYCEDNSNIDEDTRQHVKEVLIERKERWLDGFRQQAAEQEIKCDLAIYWEKHVHNAAVRLMEKEYFDLTIKSSQQHHNIVDRVFSSSDSYLIRHCNTPLLLVKGKEKWEHNRVIASIDATSHDNDHVVVNDNILAFSEHLADHFETDLHLVNAFPNTALMLAMLPEVIPPTSIAEDIQNQHQDACETYAQKYSVNADHIHIYEGEAAEVIAKAANKIDADVIVVGTSGANNFDQVLLGSTAEQILDHTDTDVILINTKDGVDEKE